MKTLTWKRVLGTGLKAPYFFSLSQVERHRRTNAVFNVSVYLLALSLVIGLPLFALLPVQPSVIIGVYAFVVSLYSSFGIFKFSNEYGIAKGIQNASRESAWGKLQRPERNVAFASTINFHMELSDLSHKFLAESSDCYQVAFIKKEWDKMVREESRIMADKLGGGIPSLLNDMVNSFPYQQVFELFETDSSTRNNLLQHTSV